MTLQQLYRKFRQNPVVATDSRKCPTGSIFFALHGENFDGNDYINSAIENGASLAVSDRPDMKPSDRVIVVDSSLEMLQQLAALHRRTLGLPIVAVTGTNGKTTTKELTAAALSARYCTHFTQGNLNNHIGVPLTLLQLTEKHEIAVIEMGANHLGEIADLCRIAQPDYGLITNIGHAHLEGFGSFDGVIRAKTELYEYIKNYGKNVFANADNPILTRFSENISSVYYGNAQKNFISGKIIASQPFLNLEWKRYGQSETFFVETQLVGDYNCENVFAAICVSSFFKVPSQDISYTIHKYVPTNNRSQLVKTSRNTLIVDAYNANPDSMRAALNNFFLSDFANKALIIGEMRELGDYSLAEHQAIIDRILTEESELVILCGNVFAHCQNISSSWRIFPSTELLTEFLKQESLTGFTILIKGSHSNRLDTIIPLL
jgi:UDP-N-acetylmuramoyl-tripeptide--D-alanyl-D-alanine ligase